MRMTSCVLTLGTCGLLFGCAGQLPIARATSDAQPAAGGAKAEPIAAAAPARKGDYCTTIQRGAMGDAHDTRIAERWPDRAYGTEEVAFTGKAGQASRAMLVGFELESIPQGADIKWAALTVRATTCATCSSQHLTAHRITAPWDEQRSTWSSFAGSYDGEAVAGAKPIEGQAGEVQFDITALVRDWVSHARPNHGVALLQDTGSTSFATSESPSAASRPRLSVCFDMPVSDRSALRDARRNP